MQEVHVHYTKTYITNSVSMVKYVLPQELRTKSVEFNFGIYSKIKRYEFQKVEIMCFRMLHLRN